MKLFEVLKPFKDFTEQVKELLWYEYRTDIFYPAHEDDPVELDDAEFLDFEDHVADVVKFARRNRITDPSKAISLYTDEIANMQPHFIRH